MLVLSGILVALAEGHLRAGPSRNYTAVEERNVSLARRAPTADAECALPLAREVLSPVSTRFQEDVTFINETDLQCLKFQEPAAFQGLPIMLVLVRYRENVTWVMNQRVKTLIINRGTDVSVKADNNITVSKDRDNFGREGAAYLKFILQFYDAGDFPDRVAFCQANPSSKPSDYSPERLLDDVRSLGELGHQQEKAGARMRLNDTTTETKRRGHTHTSMHYTTSNEDSSMHQKEERDMEILENIEEDETRPQGYMNDWEDIRTNITESGFAFLGRKVYRISDIHWMHEWMDMNIATKLFQNFMPGCNLRTLHYVPGGCMVVTRDQILANKRDWYKRWLQKFHDEPDDLGIGPRGNGPLIGYVLEMAWPCLFFATWPRFVSLFEKI